MDTQAIKQKISEYATKFIKDKMIVGLGSGSTVNCFIEALGKKCKNGLKIQAVASSQTSWDLAESNGIDVIDFNEAPRIHLTIDGADEIDHQKRMIKGGGGALLREKILASSSDHILILVDESKYVPKLGKFPLAIEVAVFGAAATKGKIEALGYLCRFRMQDNDFYLTENGNLILDLLFSSLLDHPEEEHEILSNIPGVLETGFFFQLAEKVIVGKANGEIQEL